jgi:DNA-binding transcriptional MerR regulator
MKNQPAKPQGLKISQLAKLAEVPIPTIKHYLNEGLLPRPIKTGRTMSYYDFECVEKVRLIKRLRAERFFPLNVIKRIIESGASAEAELALGEALLNNPSLPARTRAVSRRQVAGHTGYSLKKIDLTEALGLISPVRTPRGKQYDAVDCRIIELIRQRENAGMPFDYSLEMMSIYRKHIRTIVTEDAKLFVQRLLPTSSPAKAAKYIREGDKALGAFMPLMKAKLFRTQSEKLIENLNAAPLYIKEIFNFRNPRAGLPPTSVDDDLLWILFAASRKRNDFHVPQELHKLCAAISALASGKAQRALPYVSEARDRGILLPLVAALEGMAHYGCVADTPGVFSPIQPILKATSSFSASRMEPDGSALWLICSYIRGAGLSIIPEVFGTHDDAASDLKAVQKNIQKEVFGEVVSELELKALFHLARMSLADEAFDAAHVYLQLLKEKSKNTFYGKWALKRLKQLDAKQQTKTGK